MSRLETERLKLRALQEWTHWASDMWIQECFDSKHPFTVLEVSRTQERQNNLILQGRFTENDFWVDVKAGKMSKSTALRGIELLKDNGGRKGSKVTYTLDSMHKERLACDIKPDDGDYESIAKIGLKYGITHPLKWDRPHFQFDQAKQQPQPVFSLSAQINRLKRAIARSAGTVRASLERTLARLMSR